MDKNKSNIFIVSLFNFLKGIVIGGCVIIPGMSAGTVIIIFGLYSTLIGHLGNFFKSKKNFLNACVFLAPLGLGGLIGIFTFSKLLEILIERFSLPVFSLFAGFVAGTIPLILISVYNSQPNKEAQPELKEEEPEQQNKTKFKLWHLIPIVAAAAVIIVFALLNTAETGVSELSFGMGIKLITAGALTAASFIIPGLSGSFMLILLGLYKTLLHAVSDLNIKVLLIFIIGVPIGLIAASKGVGFLLKRFKTAAYLSIAGLLSGSVTAIFFYKDTYASGTNAIGITCAVLLFVIGFIAVLSLSKFRKNKDLL